MVLDLSRPGRLAQCFPHVLQCISPTSDIYGNVVPYFLMDSWWSNHVGEEPLNFCYLVVDSGDK